MEYSPLRFLDYDASLMLAEQVPVSREVEARKFHSENYNNKNEYNNYYNKKILSVIFSNIYNEIEKRAVKAQRIFGQMSLWGRESDRLFCISILLRTEKTYGASCVENSNSTYTRPRDIKKRIKFDL